MKRSPHPWSMAAAVLLTAAAIVPGAADQTSLATSSPNVARQNKVPGTIESTARRLANHLRQSGYEVGRGYFKLYAKEDCALSFQVMRNCYGNNPAAPYVIPVVPSWRDEWVDPATAGAIGATDPGYSASYRLHPREAIVILGMMPPPADYFGLQTYLFTRPGEWDETSMQYVWLSANAPALLEMFFGRVPANPERLQAFANVTNSINNVVIQAQSESLWDQPRYFVITPDEGMDAVVRDALAVAGVPDERILTEAIPRDVQPRAGDPIPLRFGLDREADDFFTAIRYAMPRDGGSPGTRSDTWRQQLPLVVMRVRDTQLADTVQPYPTLVFDQRTGTEPPETALLPDLVALGRAICTRWQPCEDFSTRVRPFVNLQLPAVLATGPECLQVGMNCVAPTEDATYFVSGKLPLDEQRVYAVAGALGTATGNATYVGLGLNSSLKKLAFDNIPDEQLAGSAAGYSLVPNHDKFFVHYFARECSGLEDLTGGREHCSSIGDSLPACMDTGDPGCDMLVISLRDYILPGTHRGVHPALALSPVLIRLDRP